MKADKRIKQLLGLTVSINVQLSPHKNACLGDGSLSQPNLRDDVFEVDCNNYRVSFYADRIAYIVDADKPTHLNRIVLTNNDL